MKKFQPISDQFKFACLPQFNRICSEMYTFNQGSPVDHTLHLHGIKASIQNKSTQNLEPDRLGFESPFFFPALWHWAVYSTSLNLDFAHLCNINNNTCLDYFTKSLSRYHTGVSFYDFHNKTIWWEQEMQEIRRTNHSFEEIKIRKPTAWIPPYFICCSGLFNNSKTELWKPISVCRWKRYCKRSTDHYQIKVPPIKGKYQPYHTHLKSNPRNTSFSQFEDLLYPKLKVEEGKRMPLVTCVSSVLIGSSWLLCSIDVIS